MRNDGRLESPEQLPQFENRLVNEGDRLKADRGASLSDVTKFIEETLKDYQGLFDISPVDPGRITLPNAWYLAKGDKLFNITRNIVYNIDYVYKDKNGMPTKEVQVSGDSDLKESDRLRLERTNSVKFMASFPRVDAQQKYEFNSSGALVSNPTPWTDTITYLVKRREPGSIDRTPFGRAKQLKKRHREYIQDKLDESIYRKIDAQWFDNIIQFDCWTKTNERSEEMVDWFENFVSIYTWVWKYNGVQEVLYWQRGQDELVTRWRNDIVNRTIQFYFRTERVTQIPISKIRKLDLLVEVEEPVTVTGPRVDPSGVLELEILDNKLGD